MQVWCSKYSENIRGRPSSGHVVTKEIASGRSEQMSLFKVRDCWSTTCGRGETFGCDALMVDDLFGTGDDNVIVGSLDGVLRVYGVHSSSASDLRYSPSDLLVEVQMDCPVLQVSTGKLIRWVETSKLYARHIVFWSINFVTCVVKRSFRKIVFSRIWIIIEFFG